jgi:hypothetical protein
LKRVFKDLIQKLNKIAEKFKILDLNFIANQLELWLLEEQLEKYIAKVIFFIIFKTEGLKIRKIPDTSFRICKKT